MFEAKIVCQSVCAEVGVPLTTFILTYPRFIHSELMTYRMWSRNAASSRAIPVQKMIDSILAEPAQPVSWGINQKGMQAAQEFTGEDRLECAGIWMGAMYSAVRHAHRLMEKGAHKQVVNRLLEPFAWMTTIVTATEWANMLSQRVHPDAQPEFQLLARMMARALYTSEPTILEPLDWHLPLIFPEEKDQYDIRLLRKIATARCARVSYLTHDGRRDVQEDLKLYERLESASPPHASPFEHVAQAHSYDVFYANLRGWLPFRKLLANENVQHFRPPPDLLKE